MIDAQTLSIVGLILEIIGAILFAVPVLKSKKQIENESSTYWGHNPPLRKAMLRDRKIGFIGLIVLLIGCGLQLVAFFI